MDTPEKRELRPPYGWALVATLAVAVLYIVTLAPSTSFWDTSEYIATSHILGIPHPPGNPLFVVLGRAWEILLAPLGLSVAVRINLFSTAMSAMAHGFWFLVIHHVLRHVTQDRFFRLSGAFIAVLVSATAFTVWNQSNVNEKVYTVSLFTIALLSWLVVRWQENLGKGKDDNLLVLMVFILALSVGNHLMAFLAAPALGIFILLVHPRTLLNFRLYVAAVVALFLGLSIHLFLPLRAALDPVINEAAPTCDSLGSAFLSILTWGQGGCDALSAALSRDQYVKPPLNPRLAPLHLQFANYLQYFDWQWSRTLQGTQTLFAAARLPFTLLFSALGLYGAVEHFKRDRPSWWYLATLFATLSVALVYYLNFKYGYSIADPMGGNPELHEVRERDYFFIVSFSVWGLWAGMGVALLWRRLSKKLGGNYRLAAPVLILACVPLVLNWPWASRAGDYSARDWAYNLLMSVEPYGVLFTNGDNDTFPLWYLQEVEGIRKDVTVIVTSYLNIDWYARQLRGLTEPCADGQDPDADRTRIICQRPYLPEGSPGAEFVTAAEASIVEARGKVPLVVDAPIRPPTRSILRLDDATIARAAQTVVPVREDRTVDLGMGVTAILRNGSLIYPWHQFALSIISNSLGDRPVYFASSGNAAGDLGLTPFLIRQGVAYRLNPGLPDPDVLEGVEEMSVSPMTSVTGMWLDVERTRKLAWEVFLHRGGLPDAWSHWPYRAVLGVPSYYAWVHYSLYQAAIQGEREEEATENMDRAEAWARLGS
ncbi:MAG: glycosyltransferase family 117 protein [Longimicrobiales bacterium]